MCECGKPIEKGGKCYRCYQRAWWLNREYGLTPRQYDLLVWGQGGACAICREKSDRLHVDHNHITGEVRGLLCMPCNQALGLLRADKGSARLQSAYAYIAMTEWVEECT